MAITMPAAAADDAKSCIEVSEDGSATVEVCPSDQAEGEAVAIAGGGVPFGAVPDWQNAIRRQVGGMQLVDMNGDGWLDLVVGCFNSSSFPPYDDWRNFIHYNTGGELELTPSWFSTDQVSTGDVQVADLNNDSHPDIFAANGGFQHFPSVIYFGGARTPNPSPGWSSITPKSTWALSAAIFDFDHDGDPDILTTNQSGTPNDNFRPLYMFRNDGGEVAPLAAWLSDDEMISNGVAVGDVDNDGWEDIAVTKWVNFECAVYRNNKGLLDALPMWTNGQTGGGRGAGFSDADGDGYLDIAFGLDPSELYHNNGDGTLTSIWASAATVPSVQELRWHDVDSDGDEDLAEIHFSTGRLHIYLNDGGKLDTAPSWTYDAPVVGNTLAFGDINGDGCDDLAIGYSGDPSIRVFYAVCPGQPCFGDIVQSGEVDVDDLLAVINAWGPCSPPTICVADLVPSGMVDVDDLLAVINAWGSCR